MAYKLSFQVLLFFVAFGFLFGNYVDAANYTAKRRSSIPRDRNTVKSGCTKYDLRDIKAFNKKAGKKIEEFHEVRKVLEAVRSPKKVEEISEEYNEIQEFFRSDKFYAMEEIYKRCEQEVPRPQAETPFWFPLDQQGTYNLL